jgi:hypothetical protein
MTGYMSLDQARAVASIPETLGAAIGVPYREWASRCHEISGELLNTGLFGPGRIARGWANGVRGQHSWIVLGEDVYAEENVWVDPTLNHWRGKPDKGISVNLAERLLPFQAPHGYGQIYAAQKPRSWGGPVVALTPSSELSEAAEGFLELLGPLDRRGWMQLASGPMQGWPAGEIIAAIDDTKRLKAVVPIDILGMLTDRDPAGIYLQHLKEAS